MTTTYIYIHGFNSGFTRENPKVPELETIGTVFGVTYDTMLPRYQIIENLKQAVAETVHRAEYVVFVGTSLGGYYAAELAKHFGVPAVCINPAIDPHITLSKYVDQTFHNYVTGVEATFTKDVFASYPPKHLAIDGVFKPFILLDAEDEVIDSWNTFAFAILKLVPCKMYTGGSHRFDHMKEALPLISEYVFDSYIVNKE